MQHEKKGRGRPLLRPEQGEGLDNYNARFTAFQARMARRIGAGNLSEGLRIALDFYVIQNSLSDDKNYENKLRK